MRLVIVLEQCPRPVAGSAINRRPVRDVMPLAPGITYAFEGREALKELSHNSVLVQSPRSSYSRATLPRPQPSRAVLRLLTFPNGEPRAHLGFGEGLSVPAEGRHPLNKSTRRRVGSAPC